MQKYIITVHSLIDFISNSSSELFICDKNKTIETIKDILTDLGKKHNIPGDSLFETVIKEPSICKYNFDLNDYPGAAEYKQFNGWDWNNKSQLEKEADEKWQEWQDNNKIDYPQSPYKYGTEEYKLHQAEWYKTVHQKFINSKKYKDYQEKRNKAYREIHAELDKKRNQVREEMIRWAFEQNNLPYTPVARPKCPYSSKSPAWKKWEKKYKSNKEFNEAKNAFETAASYGYKLEKGNILIESQEDNSIPWEMMDDITDVFGGQRIHIG